ncbi:OTU domain-containing protein At3g57810 [Phalaenopsis equestris]|uniref:OTU domain-containing protein At3g57810 n=1 Tax=Phalaenopsis equestris TaxID=78828 RepID=UPI0009E408B7|nr:OTU domain-containing protein At3g57810 [Phalaenopsis equestris]
MFGFIPSVPIPRCSSSSLYIHSSHFRRKYMDLTIRRSFLSPLNGFRVSKSPNFALSFSKQIGGVHPLNLSASVCSHRCELNLGLTSSCRSMSLRLPMSGSQKIPKNSWNARQTSLAAAVSFGLCLSFSSSGVVNAKASENGVDKLSSLRTSHGKEVCTDYTITGIPGDGRCLFRSVAHGACIRAGKSIPDETLQRELADELRDLIADEFIKRREETEWFIEGSFDDYVSQIRQPHVWGGEPELLMASHVLQMPITVYIHDDEAGGLIAIAEYGQEYGKEDPIRVLYHGFGHYEALQIPGRKPTNSRL